VEKFIGYILTLVYFIPIIRCIASDIEKWCCPPNKIVDYRL